MLEHDLVGVGGGPTNLSLAALIETARVQGRRKCADAKSKTM
jgi:lysine/ornithine N-monooxygenase